MNELMLLGVFYYEALARATDISSVFLSVDDEMVQHIKVTFDIDTSIEELETLAANCIALRWLERTTADPFFNFLSLTDKGLERFMDSKYYQRT